MHYALQAEKQLAETCYAPPSTGLHSSSPHSFPLQKIRDDYSAIAQALSPIPQSFTAAACNNNHTPAVITPGTGHSTWMIDGRARSPSPPQRSLPTSIHNSLDGPVSKLVSPFWATHPPRSSASPPPPHPGVTFSMTSPQLGADESVAGYLKFTGTWTATPTVQNLPQKDPNRMLSDLCDDAPLGHGSLLMSHADEEAFQTLRTLANGM